jgi:hypothetical protein
MSAGFEVGSEFYDTNPILADFRFEKTQADVRFCDTNPIPGWRSRLKKRTQSAGNLFFGRNVSGFRGRQHWILRYEPNFCGRPIQKREDRCAILRYEPNSWLANQAEKTNPTAGWLAHATHR